MIITRMHYAGAALLVTALLLAGCSNNRDKTATTTPNAGAPSKDAAPTSPSTDQPATVEVPPELLIEPGTGMAGVRLGIPRAAALKILGKPIKVSPPATNLTEPTIAHQYPWGWMWVLVRTNRVSSLHTTDKRMQTAGGLGVGSTMAELKTAHPRIKCEKAGVLTYCNVPGGANRSILTTYHVDNDKVVAVAIGEI